MEVFRGTAKPHPGFEWPSPPPPAAVRLLEPLGSAKSAGADDRRELAFAHFDMGDNLRAMHLVPQAIESYSKALRSFEALRAADPQDADARLWMGSVSSTLGPVLAEAGRRTEARAALERARAELEETQRGDPGNVQVSIALANAYQNSGIVSEPRGNGSSDAWLEARRSYQKSLAIWLDLRARGKLVGFYSGKPQEVTAQIERCDAAMAH